MFEHLPAENILKKALHKGGNFSELFFEHSRETKIVCEDKKIERVISGIDCGAGLRVISNLKTAYGYTNDLSPSSLLNLADDIAGSVAGKNFDRDINLKKRKPQTTFSIKQPPAQVPIQEKVKLVQKAEKLAWSLDKRIVQVRIRYSDIERHTEIAHSEGDYAVSPKTLSVLAVFITASDGKTYHMGFDSLGGHTGYEIFEEEKIEQIVKKAVHRALLNLTADRASGGTMPVIICAEAGGTFIHEAVGHGLEADLACQGLSVYEGRIGERVASSKITVLDDPTIPGKRGSYLFDDEGSPSEKTCLIDKGILKTYMFDRLTAMKMKTKSNGHGRRESYEYRPIVRMTNTMIAPGKDDPEEIIRSVDKGLMVKMMGGGQVNTVNGDFMFEVSEGYRIENGKQGEPVRGATLTGNGPDVLKSIDRVGNDLGFGIGTCGKDGQGAPVSDAMPTVRIPELVVGGIVNE